MSLRCTKNRKLLVFAEYREMNSANPEDLVSSYDRIMTDAKKSPRRMRELKESTNLTEEWGANSLIKRVDQR